MFRLQLYSFSIILVIILTIDCHSLSLHGSRHESTTLQPFPDILKPLTENDLNKAATMGINLMEKQKRLENHIAHSPAQVSYGTISHGLLLESLPTNESIRENYVGDIILKATKHLMNSKCRSHGVSNNICASYVSQYRIPEGSSLKNLCLEESQKSNQNTIYRRLLPNNYKDGVYEFPVSDMKYQLPDARYIAEQLFIASNTVNKRTKQDTESQIDLSRTIAIAQWAAFIEQDLARTVQRTMHDGTPIECCDKMYRKFAPRSLHSACHPLAIKDNDIFYKKLGVSCLNYVRSAIAVNPQCKFGAANQINQATNRLDLSQIYGVNDADLRKIRKYHGGKLHTHDERSPLANLPYVDDQKSKYCRSNDSESCYISGDPRVNSNPYSMALHTIFLRSHNKIASDLGQRHPQWNDDELFHMSRLLNTIIYQRIIYEEWAPIVLGKESAERILLSTYTQDGNEVSNEFATVGIRFYNTMFPGNLLLTEELSNNIDVNNRSIQMELFKLQDVQYRGHVNRQSVTKIMTAVTSQHAMALDTSYVEDLSNQLYQTTYKEGETFGSDSLALDIQRSRDHGLQSYIKYLSACKNTEIHSWSDLITVMKPKDINILMQIYQSVSDIDLIVGALSEIPLPGALLGPTMQCIIEEQLINTKVHDPSFYKNVIDDIGIQGVGSDTLSAKLLCGTTLMDHVQRNIFLIHSSSNPFIDCSKVDHFPNNIRLKAN
uniref:CSON005035 protein n=1 Tax=Culicoides sonorensis TaxID=179676 RepID=A0A336MW58_CULSO